MIQLIMTLGLWTSEMSTPLCGVKAYKHNIERPPVHLNICNLRAGFDWRAARQHIMHATCDVLPNSKDYSYPRWRCN